jgi:peptide/nickel transport system substrate-binding protein
MRRHVGRTGLASGLALIAMSCSGGGHHATTASGAASASRAARVIGFNAGVAGVRNPSARRGGTLRLIADGDCDSWDPARTYVGYCWNMQRLFSRALMARNPAPGPAGLDVVPDLAQAPGSSTDGKTWTYHLRPGLMFQDGTPITSHEVKYAVERTFAQDVINGGPTYVVTYLCPTAPNASGGCDSYTGPYRDRSPDHLGLSTIDTPNDTTIVFHLNAPLSDWNYVMALPGSAPVPIAYDLSKHGGAHYAERPFSSGPYEFASYVPGKSLKLVRNPHWSEQTDPFRKALPDTIVFTVDANDRDIDNRLLDNVADMDVAGLGVQLSTQARILPDPTLKARADNPPLGATWFIALETHVKPFDNIDCRIAVQYAISKRDFQVASGGPIGGGNLATSLLNPAVKGFEPLDIYPDDAGKGDLAKARTALARCGHPHGFAAHLATFNTTKGRAQAESVQASLRRVGISVTIDASDPSSYFSQFIGAPAVNRAMHRGMMIMAWGADWPTAYGFFSPLVDGRKILAQGNANTSELDDPKVDALLDQATETLDPNAAAKISNDVDRQVMTDATLVPVMIGKALVITSTRATNVYVLDSLGGYDIQALGCA